MGIFAIERTPARICKSLLDAVVGPLPLWAVRACFGYHMTAEPLAKRPDLSDMTVFSDCSGNTAQRIKKTRPIAMGGFGRFSYYPCTIQLVKKEICVCAQGTSIGSTRSRLNGFVPYQRVACAQNRDNLRRAKYEKMPILCFQDPSAITEEEVFKLSKLGPLIKEGHKSEAQRNALAQPTFSMNGIKPRRNEKRKIRTSVKGRLNSCLRLRESRHRNLCT